MNIPSPSLHAARREPAASRPLPETTANANARDPAGFASLLRQSQAAPRPVQTAPPPRKAESASSQDHGVGAAPAAAPASTPTSAPAHEQGPDADPMDNPSAADGTPTTAPQGRLRPGAPGKPRPEGPTGVVQREAKVTTNEEADRDTDTAAKAGLESLPPQPLPPAIDTSLAPTPATWLAALQPGQRGTPADDASGHPSAADSAAGLTAGAMPDPAAGLAATGSKPDAVSVKRGADKADANEARVDVGAAAAAVANGGRFAQALTEHTADKPPPQATARSADAATAIGASFVATPNTGNPTAPAVAVALATPVTAPEFAQELGLRMSMLAQGGVQHAELHLNPADMGPVSVQIVLDGNQARVDFGADVAATRAAIEAGLPALASALNDAGFTLSGGGVSQHSRGRGDGDGRNKDSSAAPRERRIEGQANDAATSAARAANRRVVRLGGLDLYA